MFWRLGDEEVICSLTGETCVGLATLEFQRQYFSSHRKLGTVFLQIYRYFSVEVLEKKHGEICKYCRGVLKVFF